MSTASAYSSRSGGSSGSVSGSLDPYNGPATFTYSAAADSYTLNEAGSPTFSPPNIVASAANFTDYEVSTGSTTRYYLSLFKRGSANTAFPLTYSSYGFYNAVNTFTIGNFTQTRRAFVYGTQTAVTDLPRSGVVSFITRIDGIWVKPAVDGSGASGLQEIRYTGTSSFSADFAANTVTFSMTIVGPDRDTGSMLTVTGLTGTGDDRIEQCHHRESDRRQLHVHLGRPGLSPPSR